jgi:integrase/recombinase XerD
MRARVNHQDEERLSEFLQQIRSRTKRRRYRQAVGHFEHFASLRTPSISLRTLRLWLHNGQKRWVLPSVIQNAQRVNRFADWLVARKAIKTNPLAQFRAHYEVGSSAELVRALLSQKPRVALKALRPLPPYGSHLGSVMHEHVKRMRTLGFRYRHEYRLQHFDRFLQRRAGAAKQPLCSLVYEYSALAPSAVTKLQRIAVGRVVAAALNRRGIATPMPRADRLLHQQALREKRRPYIYTEHEIRRLLHTALELPSPLAPYRPQTVYTMLVLAYCAGLRLAEISSLTLGALDLPEGAIEIRNTKFFKSRRLPLSATALEALRTYMAVRRKVGAPNRPDAPLFWHARGPYHYVTVGALMALVIRRAGLKKQRGRIGPRIHDIRHAFVVHRMTKWYREGINPENRLPYLATYLGHRSVHSTRVYLTVTQELIRRASDRFCAAEPEVRRVILGTTDA